MRKIKVVQYPFVQPPNDNVIEGGVGKVTTSVDGVSFSKATGDETYYSKYENRQEEQFFVPGQNYWFINISEEWIPRWELDSGSPGQNIDRLLFAINSQIDPGVIFTTTIRHPIHQLMFSSQGEPITRDGSFISTLQAVETEPNKIHLDVSSVTKFLTGISGSSVFSEELSDKKRDEINAEQLYMDALYSFDVSIQWSYLWFCLENIVGSGYGASNDVLQYLTENDLMTQKEAKDWKDAVNRIKHPDKGENIEQALTDISLPHAINCRKVTSKVLTDYVME